MTPPLPTPVFTNQNPSFRPVSTSSQFSSPQPTRSTAWPLIPDSDEPAPPLYPLSHRPGQQALFTTYPSRLRLGTTSLVQPIFTNTYIQQRIDRAHSPHDTLPSSNSSLLHSSAKHVSNFPHLTHPSNGSVSDLGRRTRKVVNYSENDNRFPEFELDSGIDDDQRGRSTARNRTGTLPASSAAKGSGSLVPPNSSEEDRRRENEALAKRKYADGKIYLGEEPPAKYIKVQRRIRKPTGIMTNLVLGELNEPVLEDQDTLVPIRIEFETEDLRIRDVFTWNLRERHISPEAFAIEFCHDIDISPSVYASKIVEQINTQLKDLSSISATKLIPAEEEIEKIPVEHLEGVEPDLRVILHLDVQIQTLHLVDRLEWDLASPLTPELFTSQYIADLHLPASGAPIIAHAIHEELLRHKRDCLAVGVMTANPTAANFKHGSVGLPTTRLETDPLMREKFGTSRGPRRLDGIWREWNEANMFGPKLEELHAEDVEWIELEKERLFRRTRREAVRPGRRR